MNNKKTIIIIEVVLAIIILALVFLLFLPKQKTPVLVVQNTSGIEVLIPKPNNTISSPLKITGSVKGDGWSGFEGQVGTVRLLDSNGTELATTYLPATTEWTTLPTSFEANLNFTAVSGGSGSLVFHNENASGDPVRDKTFTVPVIFK